MVSFGPAKMLRVKKESSLHTNTQAVHTVHTTCTYMYKAYLYSHKLYELYCVAFTFRHIVTFQFMSSLHFLFSHFRRTPVQYFIQISSQIRRQNNKSLSEPPIWFTVSMILFCLLSALHGLWYNTLPPIIMSLFRRV